MIRQKQRLKAQAKSSLRLLTGLVLVFAGVVGLITDEAEAACAWTVYADVGDTSAPCGRGQSEDGSFKTEPITSDSGEEILKITLTNYHGGTIYAECCGTCAPSGGMSKTIIELIGDNMITAESGVGINLHSPVEFTGEGSLEIVAMIPIGGGNLCGTCRGHQGSECNATVWNPYSNTQDKLEWTLGTSTLVVRPTTIAKEVETPLPGQINQDENGTPTEDRETSLSSDEDEKKCPDSALTEQTPDSGWTVWDITAAVYVGVSLIAFVGLMVRWFIKRKKAAISEDIVPQNSENGVDGRDNTQGML